MRIGIVLGAALAFAPALALADQPQLNQPQGTQQMNQPQGRQMNQPQGTQMNQPEGTRMNQPEGTQANQNLPGNQPSMRSGEDSGQAVNDSSKAEETTQKLLPKDAKLIGTVESADVRAFPEQMSEKAKSTGTVEKEGVVGVGGLDRVWTTKQPYKQAVSQLDQKLKKQNIEPIAKTTTQSATAWNVRMPDGHIANVVVRNTQPTTIEAVQAAVVTGTVTDKGQPDRANTK